MTGPTGTAGESVIRPGLDRILLALSASGHPERSFRAFHIAGTNGKGSTAVFLDAILRRLLPGPVGLYTSPHLLSPEERIRIDGGKIPHGDLDRGFLEAGRLSEAVRQAVGEPLSWFESMTWTAFDWFRRNRVDRAVLEAGLGGRWDATNVCVPIASVVTRIGIDHREWLGGTIREIAFEKAGILRAGVPCLLGRLGATARRVVLGAARAAGAPVWELGRDFRWTADGRGDISIVLPGLAIPGLRLAASGRFQCDNAALACAAAWRLMPSFGVSGARFADALRSALGETRPPGRFQPLTGRENAGTWVDGGHNPDAARALSRELIPIRKAGSRIVAVWSMLRDKDAGGFLRAMRRSVAHWVVYPLSHERAATTEVLACACRAAEVDFETAPDFPGAWRAARLRAGRDGVVIVCGSFVAVGDAYRHRLGDVP